MYKYLLIPALCCLIISSCVTTQNTTHSWDQLGETKKKQKRMSVCDCIDLFTQIQKEMIASFHDADSKASMDSIINEIKDKYESEITFCAELDKNMTQKQREKRWNKAERCKSFDEIKKLGDSLNKLESEYRLRPNWGDEIGTDEVLCDCLSQAQSEEEAQACAPNKSMDELEAIFTDCLDHLEDMEIPDIEELEEMMEEMEGPLVEEGDKSACDCLKEAMNSEEILDKAPAGCEWMDNLDDNQLMEELKDCPEMAAMFEIVMPDMEEMDAIAPEMEDMMEEALEEEDEYIDDILTLEEELEALNEERRELIIHIRALELDISEIKYELKTYDTIPNFDTELCVCYINEGYMVPETPCNYPEMSEDEWEKFGRDCERFDFLQQEIEWMSDNLDEELHYLDVLDMDIEELEELEETLEEEDYELLEAEHNPEGASETLEEEELNKEWTTRMKAWMGNHYYKRITLEQHYDELQDEINEIEKEASRTNNVDIIMCDCLSSMLPEVCAPNHSKQQIDSIVSLCNDYGYRDDLFARRTEIWSELHDMQSEIGTLIEKEIKQIHQKNEELWDQWESRLEYIVDNTIKEEKLRLVKHLLDQETIQADKVADIDMGVLVDESNYRLSMKKEFIKEYDLLEELKKENKKALQELNSELPKLSFYYNPDLAFKAQEIFSALESEDFDLFLDLVKVDTVDFFYWRIPSTDFNRKNLEGMSIEIEGGNGPITVNALEYVEMFKDFDLHLLEQDKGRQKGSGYDGSCALRSGVAYCENDCYELMVFNDDYCLSYLLEEYGSIEELIPDPYLMRDALSHCSTQSEIWMAFDKSSGFKFIGVYDWYWTP